MDFALLDLILWILAVICWLVAAFGRPRMTAWGGLVPLGLALAGITFITP